MFDLLILTQGKDDPRLNIWQLLERDMYVYPLDFTVVHCLLSKPNWFPLIPKLGCIGIAHVTERYSEKSRAKLKCSIPIHLLWKTLMDDERTDLYRCLNEDRCLFDNNLVSHPILPLASAIKSMDDRLLSMILRTFPVVQLDVFAGIKDEKKWYSVEDWLNLFEANKVMRSMVSNARLEQGLYLSNVWVILLSDYPQEIRTMIHEFYLHSQTLTKRTVIKFMGKFDFCY
jgi:hypothetical protein